MLSNKIAALFVKKKKNSSVNMLLFKLISMLSNKMATLILRSKQNGSTNVDMFRQCDIPIEFNLMIQNGL